MGAADRRRALLERHRELASRHEILDRAGPDSDRYEDLFLRVIDAADDLIRDLDRARDRAAAQRRILARVLAAAALVPVGLVAAGLVPSLWLAGAALTGAAAAVLWLTARLGAATGPAPARPGAAPAPTRVRAVATVPTSARGGSARSGPPRDGAVLA